MSRILEPKEIIEKGGFIGTKWKKESSRRKKTKTVFIPNKFFRLPDSTFLFLRALLCLRSPTRKGLLTGKE